MDFGDRLDNLNSAALQANSASGQCHQLAPPQTGVRQDLDQRPVRSTGLGQGLHLVVGQERSGFPTTRGRGTPSATFLTNRPSRTAAVSAREAPDGRTGLLRAPNPRL
jgi:hypothetical protein